MGRSSSKSPKTFLVLFLIALSLGFGCQKKEEPPKDKQIGTIPILSPAAFGKAVQAHKGHVLVVNFFTTWCEPCRKELPDLIKLARRYRSKGVDVIGVSLDKSGGRALRPFLEKINIPYPIYLASQSLMDTLKIDAIPATCFYNKHGKQVGPIIKGRIRYDILISKVETLLKIPD